MDIDLVVRGVLKNVLFFPAATTVAPRLKKRAGEQSIVFICLETGGVEDLNISAWRIGEASERPRRQL
jgi:2-keto-3-deoxy-6-phosphogluconate aldolase